MRWTALHALGLCVVLGSCAGDKQDALESSEAETASGDGEAAGGMETSEDAGCDSMGPADCEGPATAEDFYALCEEQSTRKDCDAVPHESYPWEDASTWCTWEQWVAVSIGGEGKCEFGPANGNCSGQSASGDIGCAEGTSCGRPLFTNSRITPDGVVELGQAGWCLPSVTTCVVNAQGELVEGIPECVCVCDADWPLD